MKNNLGLKSLKLINGMFFLHRDIYHTTKKSQINYQYQNKNAKFKKLNEN